jgi:hypothetical protein
MKFEVEGGIIVVYQNGEITATLGGETIEKMEGRILGFCTYPVDLNNDTLMYPKPEVGHRLFFQAKGYRTPHISKEITTIY